MTTVYAYWWRGQPNFGDLLTPFLLERELGVDVRWTDRFERCDVVAVGSIAHKVDWRRFRGALWGTGSISPDETYDLQPETRVLAVRGQYSRAQFGLSRSVPLGDPGLLVHRHTPASSDRYRVCFVPHYIDDRPSWRAWARELGWRYVSSSLQPDEFLHEIAGAERVISSAMHPIIAAHSLAKPAVRVRLSGSLAGGDFKFEDYASAVPDLVEIPTLTVSGKEDLVRADELSRSVDPPRTAGVEEGILSGLSSIPREEASSTERSARYIAHRMAITEHRLRSVAVRAQRRIREALPNARRDQPDD